MIAIHPTHNKAVEKLVQSTSYVRSTNIEANRASARMRMLSATTHEYNAEALAAKREKTSTEEERKKVQQTKDAVRLQGLADKIDSFSNDIKDIANRDKDHGAKIRSIVKDMRSNDTKAQKAEEDKKVAKFTAAADRPNKISAAMVKKDPMHVTAACGGSMTVSFLRKTVNGHKDAVEAEIIKRGIECPEELTDFSADYQWVKKMSWYPLRRLLQVHELTLKPGATIGGKAMQVADVKTIVPQSDELKALRKEHNDWQAAKRAK
jgi:hypothetical protein